MKLGILIPAIIDLILYTVIFGGLTFIIFS